MHVMTTWNIPKIGKMNLSSPKKMIAHMEELGIGKAVLMSSGEKKIPFAKNIQNTLPGCACLIMWTKVQSMTDLQHTKVKAQLV